MTRRGLAAALLAAAALLPAPAWAAETPDPSAVVPEHVSAWFAEQAVEAAASAGLGDPAVLEVGVPRRVATWSESYVDGEQVDQLTDPLDEWVAPVLLPTPDAPEPLGAVHAGAQDGSGLGLIEVREDIELAAGLARLPVEATVVRGAGLEGWFGIVDGEVWPVSEGARTVLQGSLPAGVFQDLLAVWLGAPAPTAEAVPDEDPNGTVSPLIPIGVIVFVGAVVAWLLVRQYRQADSRIAADVHAGVAPPAADVRRPAGDPEPDGG